MPIYEYVCRACGFELERLQRLSDAPLRDCPDCNEPALKRKMSAAGFRLSGGGWYETDFKSDGRRNLAGGDDKSGKTDSTSEKSNGDAGQSADNSGAGKSDTAKPKSADKAKTKNPGDKSGGAAKGGDKSAGA